MESKLSGKVQLYDTFELLKRVRVVEIPIFNQVTMQFFFRKVILGEKPNTLIFCKRNCIFSYNFIREEVQIIYEFKKVLELQPDFFNMDHT